MSYRLRPRALRSLVFFVGFSLAFSPLASVNAYAGGGWKEEPNLCDRFVLALFGPRHVSGRNPEDRRAAYLRGLLTTGILAGSGYIFYHWDGELPRTRWSKPAEAPAARAPRETAKPEAAPSPFVPKALPATIDWERVKNAAGPMPEAGEARAEVLPGNPQPEHPVVSLFAAGLVGEAGKTDANLTPPNGVGEIAERLKQRAPGAPPLSLSLLVSDEAGMKEAVALVATSFPGEVSFEIFYAGVKGESQLEILREQASAKAGSQIGLDDAQHHYLNAIKFQYATEDGSVRRWRTVDRSEEKEENVP